MENTPIGRNGARVLAPADKAPSKESGSAIAAAARLSSTRTETAREKSVKNGSGRNGLSVQPLAEAASRRETRCVLGSRVEARLQRRRHKTATQVWELLESLN